ncbi:hypothetical protein GW17_00060746 [Ensete ventricosum]|nr:hypothetical protein GW17_00060746 [Ensete ventricosum]
MTDHSGKGFPVLDHLCGSVTWHLHFFFRAASSIGDIYTCVNELVSRTWVTSSLQYLTSRQLLVVGGIVHWSAAASALTRHPLPAVRGQGVLFVGRLLRLP